jgi:hypothetical protein
MKRNEKHWDTFDGFVERDSFVDRKAGWAGTGNG